MPPSGIRRFFDMLAEMKDVISLTIGEPDFTTPEPITRAAIASLEAGETHYTANGGMIELRELIAANLARSVWRRLRPADRAGHHGRRVRGRRRHPARDDQSRRRGHLPRAVLRGLRPVHPAGRRRGRRGRHDRRHRLPRHRRDDRRRDHAAHQGDLPRLPEQPDRRRAGSAGAGGHRGGGRRHDLLVFSDEIYDRLVYGEHEHTAFSALPAMRERTVLLGGFSKSYAMTGWRIGYVAAPAELMAGIAKVHQYGIMCAPTARPVRRHRGAAQRRAASPGDARRVRPPPPLHDRSLQRDRPA